MAKSLTYKDGDPFRVVTFGAYNGMTCIDICRKDKDARKWQAWICDKTHDVQLRCDLQKAMIIFIEEFWLEKFTKGAKK